MKENHYIFLGTFICDLLHFGAPGSGGCVWKVAYATKNLELLEKVTK